jgi:hypothetical protein
LKEPDPEAGTKEGNMVSDRSEINGEKSWCGWFCHIYEPDNYHTRLFEVTQSDLVILYNCQSQFPTDEEIPKGVFVCHVPCMIVNFPTNTQH